MKNVLFVTKQSVSYRIISSTTKQNVYNQDIRASLPYQLLCGIYANQVLVKSHWTQNSHFWSCLFHIVHVHWFTDVICLHHVQVVEMIGSTIKTILSTVTVLTDKYTSFCYIKPVLNYFNSWIQIYQAFYYTIVTCSGCHHHYYDLT